MFTVVQDYLDVQIHIAVLFLALVFVMTAIKAINFNEIYSCLHGNVLLTVAAAFGVAAAFRYIKYRT